VILSNECLASAFIRPSEIITTVDNVGACQLRARPVLFIPRANLAGRQFKHTRIIAYTGGEIRAFWEGVSEPLTARGSRG
jgi:hypothetical protein